MFVVMTFIEITTVAETAKFLFLYFTCVVSHRHFVLFVFLLQVYKPVPINSA